MPITPIDVEERATKSTKSTGLVADQLGCVVIKKIQDNYLAGKMRKTNDCMDDMLRDNLYEADVEKVIMGAQGIEKVMPATSAKASSPLNTHYVIYGQSTKGEEVYCKICTNYHPQTEAFLCWKLTSFCLK